MANDTIDILLTEFNPAPPATVNDGHDLDLTTSDLRIVQGLAKVQQDLNIALWWFLGEWPFDQSIGVDWFSLLGQKYNAATFEATTKKAILAVEDVDEILSYILTWDNAARKVSLTFTAKTAFGIIDMGI